MLFTHASNPEREIPETKKEVILEIELNGKVRFDCLLNDIYQKLGIMYKIVSADVEFFGDQNFGNIKLLIMVSSIQHQDLRFFLNDRRLLNTSVENVQRKAV